MQESPDSPNSQDLSKSESSEALTISDYAKFLTRVWFHPLLNEQTLKHREEGMLRFSSYLQRFNLDADSFIALPIGAAVWSVEPNSDYDIVVICNDYELLKKIEWAYKGKHQEEFGPIKTRERYAEGLGMHITAVAQMEAELLNKKGQGFLPRVFLTPDMYISGDLDEVAKLRLHFLSRIQELDKVSTFWDNSNSVMHTTFDRWYREWRYLPNIDNKRQQRYNERLEMRALQALDPELYKIAFEITLSDIQIPPFDTCREDLINGKGHINILPDYKAQGIKQ